MATKIEYTPMRIIQTSKENAEKLLAGESITTTEGEVITFGMNDILVTPDELTNRVVELERIIALIQGIREILPVASLPTENISTTTMYLVTEGDDAGTEYLYVNGKWEPIGSTKVDTSKLVTTDTEQTITGAKNFKSPLTVSSTDTEGNQQYTIYGVGKIEHQENGSTTEYSFPKDGGTLATEEAKVTVNLLTDLGYNASVGKVFLLTWFKWNTNPQRMSYEHVFYAEYDLQVTVNTGYQVGICYCANSAPSSAYFDMGWLTEYPYTIPKGSWFIVNIKREDNANLTDSDIGNVFIRYTSTAISREQKLAEIRLDIQEPIEYGYSGDVIDFKKRGYRIKELLSVHDTSVINQGMAVHNGTIFRMLSSPANTIEVRDFPSCENVKYLRNIQIGHASSCCFSNEYHTDTDEFPLLYVADCYEPKIYVVRIANKNWATTLKTIYLGTVEEIGYYTSISIDFVNKKLYVFGYTNNNLYSAENPKFYTVWDLSSLTENEDGTFTPTLIGEKKYISFPTSITVTQDVKFFDGKIVLLTSTDTYTDTAIYFIEPSSGEITSTMANFDGNLKAWEIEGMEFALNEGGSKYDIILSPIYRGFYKLEFI